MSELVDAGHVPQGNAEAIRAMATRNNISLEVEEPKIKEGWVGKAKGMKQILYERHMIDLDNMSL